MKLDDRPPLQFRYRAGKVIERWRGVRASVGDWLAFESLCQGLRDEYFSGTGGKPSYDGLARAMYAIAYQRRGSFIEDSDYLADEVRVLSRAQMAFLQRQYTWAHVARYFGLDADEAVLGSIGCSTACIRTSDGWRMMRSLDWGNAALVAPAVRAIDYVDAGPEGRDVLHTAGVLGMAGVLTFAGRGVCGAINFAPSRSVIPADFDPDPLFLLRALIEDHSWNRLTDCVQRVWGWNVSAPVFVTLCDSASERAIVVEITRSDRKAIRESRNGLLVQTNHFDSEGPFPIHNPLDMLESGPEGGWANVDLLRSSAFRRAVLEHAPTGAVGLPSDKVLAICLKAYSIPPVMNKETIHWCWCDPGAGSMKLWVRPPTSN